MPIHPALAFLRLPEKGKVVSAAEAVRLIRDGDAVATGGFVGIGFAEEIALALEELYLSNESEALYTTGKPKCARLAPPPPAARPRPPFARPLFARRALVLLRRGSPSMR